VNAYLNTSAFNSELTGEENIYQHGQVMGLSDKEIKEKENEIIEFADIGDHLYQPVKTYSSGMFARLAFACAINVEPDILIVDEVLSVGDVAFQLKCFKKFEQFKKSGKTIIFVTHNIADVLKNCNRAIILEHGKKTFDGDVKTGVDKYKKIIVGMSDSESKEMDKNAKEANIDLDSNKKEFNDEEHKKLVRNLKNIHKKYGAYVQISYLFDKWDLLGYKDSPIDQGKDVFLELFKRRIII
jgi:teichoic acid transport system ATP-binding protein